MKILNILFLLLFLVYKNGYSQPTTGYFPEKKMGTVAYKNLDIKGEAQSQSQWCWAAVSATVINHYNYYKINPCQIASEAFKTNCCLNEKECNNQNSLLFISEIIEKYSAATTIVHGIVSASEIKNEIDKNNPMILRIESKFSGHFIVIGGYSINRDKDGNDELFLMIQDPMWGYQINTNKIGEFVSYNSLKNGFWGNYNFRWTHTMLFEEYE